MNKKQKQSSGFESLKTFTQCDFVQNQIIEVAALLQNCWISYDEEGEENFLSVDEVSLKDILPLSLRLTELVIKYLPVGTTVYNVAICLVDAISSKPYEGRAYAIKSTAQQLADMAIQEKVEYPQKTDLPF